MAEEKVEAREPSWRNLLPWVEIFRGFQVALDPGKLALAAAGIFVTAFGWWLLALIFTAGYPKEAYSGDPKGPPDWEKFKRDRQHWNLMYETAGFTALEKSARYEVGDLAETFEEYEVFKDVETPADFQKKLEELRTTAPAAKYRLYLARTPLYLTHLGKPKPEGRLSTWPWFEDRGPNPFLLVTGQAGIPWEPGHFWEWFARDQFLVMVEPLVKLFRPVVYFFSPRAGAYARFYFLLVIIWTVATWSLFGGAITRMAAVQIARGDRLGTQEAFRFTWRRFLSYVAAPLIPLVIALGLAFALILFSLPHLVIWLGDLWSGILWPIPIALGFAMAIFLVGMVGWPLSAATISTEGTDAWEGFTRSFHYIFSRPWHCLWYSLVAVLYGSVLVFFVGFITSMAIYLAKWGVSADPLTTYVNRDPSFLFVYAPTSFGWRDLLLQGAKVGGENVVENGHVNPEAYDKYLGRNEAFNSTDEGKKETLTATNALGARLVAFWLGVAFLLMLGFGYSFFWSAGTIIFLLLRKSVDSAEMDEVYLEEEDQPGSYGAPLTPAAPPPPAKTTQPLVMVEPPTYRPSGPPATTPPVPVPSAASPPSSPEVAPPSAPTSPPSPGDGSNPAAS